MLISHLFNYKLFLKIQEYVISGFQGPENFNFDHLYLKKDTFLELSVKGRFRGQPFISLLGPQKKFFLAL